MVPSVKPRKTKKPRNDSRATPPRGRKGGRPKGLSNKAQHTAIIAEKLYQEGELTTKEVCEQLSISKMTLYNYLRHRGVEIGTPRKNNKIMKVCEERYWQ